MPVQSFDHYNLRAPRGLLDELRDFYRDVVGLSVGERPAFRRFGYWLYIADQPVLHLGEADVGEACPADVTSTFNHVSFRCAERAQFERILVEHEIPFRVAIVPQTAQEQIFFKDPAGNGVELIFPASE